MHCVFLDTLERFVLLSRFKTHVKESAASWHDENKTEDIRHSENQTNATKTVISLNISSNN